ncbi:hypothetical protein NIES4106_23690 [Fischerella sp. NIES-4106]|nr:hypothetical protein NIES4106_23690 [Fischerella sp. NIES-4106]
MQNTFLHEILAEGIPPIWGFKYFIVGSLKEQSKRIINEIKNISCNDRASSKTILILGSNGDGKTLLSQLALHEITKLNKLPVRESLSKNKVKIAEIEKQIKQQITSKKDDIKNNDILYLCSNISVKQVTTKTEVTRLIAKSLSRSIYEKPEQTFRAIILRLTQKILEEHKPDFWERLFSLGSLTGKVLISNIIQLKQEELEKFSELLAAGSDEAEEALKKLRSIIDDQLKIFFQNKALRRKLTKLSSNYYLNDYLKPFVLGKAKVYDTENIADRQIFDLFTTEMQIRDLSAEDELNAVHELARHAGCKLMVIILDECSPIKDPTSWLTSIIDIVSKFDNPKVLMLIMGITEVWESYNFPKKPDKSLLSRLYIDELDLPIRLQPATEEDISELWSNLKDIIVKELEENNQKLEEIKIPEDYFKQYQGKPYREIIRRMINKILKNKRDIDI